MRTSTLRKFVLVAPLLLGGCTTAIQLGAAAPGFGEVVKAATGGSLTGGLGSESVPSAGLTLADVVWDGFGITVPNADAKASDFAISSALKPGTRDRKFIWKEPTTGDHGTMTVTGEILRRDGSRCWDYDQSIVLHGKGTAGSSRVCKNAQGAYEVAHDKTVVQPSVAGVP